MKRGIDLDISTVVFGCFFFLGFIYTAFQIFLKDWARATYGAWVSILFVMLGTWYLPWGKTLFSFPILFLFSIFSFHALTKNKDFFAFVLSVVSLVFFLINVFILSGLH